MTWDQFKATGSGSLAFRISSEGCPVDFVSHPSMVKTGTSRDRYDGLKLRGFKLKRNADITKAKLEVGGFAVDIVDVDNLPSSVLGKRPTQRTWISEDIDTTQNVIPVSSVAGWPSSGILQVDREACLYLATTNVPSPRFTGVSRGWHDTLAQAHYAADGALRRWPEVTDHFVQWRGRRQRLYAYGEGDDPQGDGNLVYLGVAASDLKWNGTTWSYVVDPITRVLRARLAGDLADPTAPRGITFGISEPFRMEFGRNNFGANCDAIDERYTVLLLGVHYETQEEFCGAVQALLDTFTASWNTKIYCISAGPEGYYFRIVTNGSPEGVQLFSIGPETEPQFQNYPQQRSGDDWATVGVLSANSEYVWYVRNASVPGAGTVPRAIFNGGAGVGNERIYLSGSIALSSFISAAQIDWGTGSGAPREYIVSALGASDRYLDLLRNFTIGPGDSDRHVITASSLPTIRLGRGYNADSENSLADLLDVLADRAATDVNVGAQPDLRSTDYDSSVWAELSADHQPSVVRRRRYYSFAPVALEDIVCPELVQAGYFLGQDSSGRMIPVRLKLPSAIDATFRIDGTNILNRNEKLATVEKQGLGVANMVVYRVGYDPIEDKFKGSPVKVIDGIATGQTPDARAITVEPKSQYVGNVLDETADLVRLASGLLGILGGEYDIATIRVPLSLFDVLLGDVGEIAHPHMVQVDGTIGTVDDPRYGLVIGQEWEPDAAGGVFTMIVPVTAPAGYAPSFRLQNITFLGGIKWRVEPVSGYLPDGLGPEDVFEVGDTIRVEVWGSSVSASLAGAVDAVSATNMTIAIIGWVPGVSTWWIGMDNTDNGTASDNERRYASIADASGRIDWDPNPDTSADVLAP